MQKWQKKFANVIKERQDFKKRYLANRKETVLNTNDNVVAEGLDWDK